MQRNLADPTELRHAILDVVSGAHALYDPYLSAAIRRAKMAVLMMPAFAFTAALEDAGIGVSMDGRGMSCRMTNELRVPRLKVSALADAAG